MSNDTVKCYYTYKEILLALREQLLKNQILINELNNLIKVEKNAGSYHFMEGLKEEDEPFKVRLIINEIEKKQSKLKVLINKITNYKFARARITGFQIFDIINDDEKYDFKLSYKDKLDENYFGDIRITDEEKFNKIISELNNSKLSNIKQEGIHVTDDLYIGISRYIELFYGMNIISYIKEDDTLKVDLMNKDFNEMLNVKLDSSLLSSDLIRLIEDCHYKDYDIELINNKKSFSKYYKFKQYDKKINLERKMK